MDYSSIRSAPWYLLQKLFRNDSFMSVFTHIAYLLFNFINLTQVHNFTVSAQDIDLPSTFGIYRKFYRNFASTNEIMKRFALS